MASNPGFCAACGSTAAVHEHHIVPRSQGGALKPTVYLCVLCHAAVHERTWDPEHVGLTKAGLERAKARGVRLGKPENLTPANAERGRALGRAAKTARADARSTDLEPLIRDVMAGGRTTLAQIAAALNDRQIRTSRGSAWSPTQVARVMDRLSLRGDASKEQAA